MVWMWKFYTKSTNQGQNLNSFLFCLCKCSVPATKALKLHLCPTPEKEKYAPFQEEFVNPSLAPSMRKLGSLMPAELLKLQLHQKATSGPALKVDEKHIAFVKFSDKHRKLLNAFIRQNPGLLEKSFSLLLKVPRFIDFDNKRSHFRSKIKHQHDHHHHSPLRISVRRAYILEDSYNQLRMRSKQDLKGRLTVHFQGEEGIDAGVSKLVGADYEKIMQFSEEILSKDKKDDNI